MRKGNTLVEQVQSNGLIVQDYDNSYSTSELFNIIKDFFPGVYSEKINNIIVGEYSGHKYSIRCKNITYLGIPHPIFKKRIQISDDLFDFYRKSIEIDATPLLIGVYSYEGNTLFTEFGIDTYITKKAHNSSAHVYTSDLSAASIDGYFQKTDYFDNRVTVFRSDMVNVFMDSLFNAVPFEYIPDIVPSQDDPLYNHLLNTAILPRIMAYFTHIGKYWTGIRCYREMFNDNYSKKGWAEWPAAYLEYSFEKYLTNNELHDYITFFQDRTTGGIDLDLKFPPINAYGDLKAHSISSRGIPGNDYDTIMRVLRSTTVSNHIYYIIAEHLVARDSEFDYEVTTLWNTLLEKKDLYSYSGKMKHDITLTKVLILDINPSNMEYLTIFRQGVNSNGRPRQPKIMIEHTNLSHFILKEVNLP